MKRFLLVVTLAVITGMYSGCYHARLTAMGADGGGYRHKTVHSLAWGLAQEKAEPDNCLSGTLHEVRTTSNFGYALITVFTLGFWSPMDVEWRCGKECPGGDDPQ